MDSRMDFYHGVSSTVKNRTSCTSQWLSSCDEWPNMSCAAASTIQPSRRSKHESKRESCKLRRATKKPYVTNAKEPIWKRRGAKPIASLKFHPIIRGDTNWSEEANQENDLLEIVYDCEWRSLQLQYYEVHSLADVEEGVVIDPITYPAWYGLPGTDSVVRALLPSAYNALLNNAMAQGYSMKTLVSFMGSAIRKYCEASIHPKKRKFQEVLILARRGSWQGVSAICAGAELIRNDIRTSVFIVEEAEDIHNRWTKEECEFIGVGGRFYRNREDLAGSKFRVVIVAFEDQYSGRKSKLPLYGEFLQHSVAIFVDPPILKCSFSTALQIATRGCYNVCQRTIVLSSLVPKPYVIDNFVQVIVVDGSLTPCIQRSSGIIHTIFPRVDGSNSEFIVPIEYTVKGNRVYFYENGVRPTGEKPS